MEDVKAIYFGLMRNLKNKIKKVIIFIIIFSSCSNVFPQTGTKYEESSIENRASGIRHLESGINQIISDPFFDHTTIAIDIFDLTDSISLYKKNEKLLLRPASNMKILTSIAGLLNLGNNYDFRTELFHSGVIDDETLYGDFFVVGGFDPDFSTDDVDSLVRVVQSLGIKKITGGIYADISKKDSLYWGNGWMWDDDPDPDAMYLSALNINNNSIEVFVEGTKTGSPAKITLIPQTDFVELINKTKTISSFEPDSFIVTRDWVNRTNKIIVEGQVRSGKIIDSTAYLEKVNVLYPEKYFLTLFKEHLEISGIIVEGKIDIKSLQGNEVYLTSINRPIDSVFSYINKESDNLDAEMFVYSIAFKDSGAPAIAENGLEAIKRFIDTLGFDSKNYSLADGSGVSHYNLISAELILESLKYMYYQEKDLFDMFYNSLAVAGIDGTLKNRMKNTIAEGNVHAKTGTLSGVSNLSGYLTSNNNHLIAFSIMIQNFVEKNSVPRKFQDRICELLVEYE
jgi:D-alanyl-D-alanine carboxypeptidase/D-alanyl-D-alanine-endopeptidase (penicillin-binding protein 4)